MPVLSSSALCSGLEKAEVCSLKLVVIAVCCGNATRTVVMGSSETQLFIPERLDDAIQQEAFELTLEGAGL